MEKALIDTIKTVMGNQEECLTAYTNLFGSSTLALGICFALIQTLYDNVVEKFLLLSCYEKL
jgi:hypothetical protein